MLPLVEVDALVEESDPRFRVVVVDGREQVFRVPSNLLLLFLMLMILKLIIYIMIVIFLKRLQLDFEGKWLI